MGADLSNSTGWYHQLIRCVKVARGRIKFRMQCHSAFDYARATHRTKLSQHGASFHTTGLSLGSATDIPLKLDEWGVKATFSLQEG